jgi:hypothetical protein
MVALQVTVSANAILHCREEGGGDSYSIYYGHDYVYDGERSMQLGILHSVWNMSDVGSLPTSFELADFDRTFTKIFVDTRVTVHSLASLVYIIRKPMDVFSSSTEGRSHVILY